MDPFAKEERVADSEVPALSLLERCIYIQGREKRAKRTKKLKKRRGGQRELAALKREDENNPRERVLRRVFGCVYY